MTALDGELARTVAAVADAGTLDAAAALLNITPSAVSQRIRALETQLGHAVLLRTRPVVLTDAGETVVRFARQLDLLESDLLADLSPGRAGDPTPLAIVVDADSLHTWALAALRGLADRVVFEVLRADATHSLALLRSGRAAGAVTTEAKPMPGCAVETLGSMRYLAVCSPGFAERWLGAGADPAGLAVAPSVAFDRTDDLHLRCLERLGASPAPAAPRAHLIPSAAECTRAIELGIGWGAVPELACVEPVRRGDLVLIDPQGFLDVPLYWQRWRRASPTLRAVSDALREAAATSLRR